MPANLPPDYFEAEKRYREAQSPGEKIVWLEKMLTIMPKHKGTDKLRADLRKRISKLKSAAQAKKSTGKRESAFNIDKEGAGQVAVVGPPNSGKSSLLVTLTNARPEVAAFPYTTWKPTPGMMPVDDIQIQLIDTPPLSREYIEPELMDLIRRADALLLVVDLQNGPLNQLEEIHALLEEQRIVAPHRLKAHPQARNLTVVPLVVLANKNDNPETPEIFEILQELADPDWTLLAGSVRHGGGLEELKRALVAALDIIRIYSKSPGKKPDMRAPFVLKRGATVADFAGKVHQDFVSKFKSARLWGTALFDGQQVQRDHVLQDGDVVELQI
jgi:hypothetical protein